MMAEVTKDKIKSAGSKIFLWRKIYNMLCRGCQIKVFRAGSNVKTIGTQGVADNMKEIIDKKLCNVCRRRVDLIIGKEE